MKMICGWEIDQLERNQSRSLFASVSLFLCFSRTRQLKQLFHNRVLNVFRSPLKTEIVQTATSTVLTLCPS